MTKRKKILLIISIVVLFVIACAVSYFWGFKKGISAGRFASIYIEVAQFSLAFEHLSAQMANADCEELKKALNQFLELLEKYKNVEAGLIVSPRSYLIDKAFTHTRLARVERHLGNNKEADRHMKIAIEACTQLKWKDCSEEKLISITKKTEQQNPIACLSNSGK